MTNTNRTPTDTALTPALRNLQIAVLSKLRADECDVFNREECAAVLAQTCSPTLCLRAYEHWQRRHQLAQALRVARRRATEAA